MEISRGKLKRLIQEEISRITSEQEGTAGYQMAGVIKEEYAKLSPADQQIFLENFVSYINKIIS